jgi:hypothetical protein
LSVLNPDCEETVRQLKRLDEACAQSLDALRFARVSAYESERKAARRVHYANMAKRRALERELMSYQASLL